MEDGSWPPGKEATQSSIKHKARKLDINLVPTPKGETAVEFSSVQHPNEESVKKYL